MLGAGICLPETIPSEWSEHTFRPSQSAKSASNRDVKGPAHNVFLAASAIAVLFVGTLNAQNATKAAEDNVVSTSRANIQPAIKPAPAKHAKLPSDAIEVDPASLLPELPPIPHANATMVGGIIQRLDLVRDRVTLSVFGGGKTTALFDPRTQVFRGTRPITIADLHEGQRAYLDTILDGNTVFARAIRLESAPNAGHSQGIVLRYRQDRGELALRDAITPTPIRIRIDPSTKFLQDGRPVPASTLLSGSLVSVTFNSEGNGRDLARDISILALPGTHFSFSGEILHLDLRSGLLVLHSSVDGKTYEIHFNPSRPPDESVHIGALVSVDTTFRDSQYVANKISTLTASR